MDYIDANLDQPLPLDRLAEVAAFSKFHFHRIFFALRTETPGQYIHRVRLSRAARMLASNRDRPITEVALECGFSDLAAFSRAFRSSYGTTPSGYRLQRSNLGTMDRNDGTEPPKGDRYDSDISRSGGENMSLHVEPIPAQMVTVVDRPEMTLAYVRYTGPYFGDEALFQRLFAKLHGWAQPRDLVVPGTTEEIIVYHDDPETVAPEKLRVSCCIAVPADTEVAGEIGKMNLEAGRYAEARFVVNAMQFAGAWNWVYGVWLPESGYQPDDKLCYEKYTHAEAEGETEMDGTLGQTVTVDICVPIKPL